MYLPSFLYTEEDRRRQRLSEFRRYERHRPDAVDWDQNMKVPRRAGELLVIRGETYKIDHVLFDVKRSESLSESDPSTFREYKNWRYRHLHLQEGMPLILPIYNRDSTPHVCFTTSVEIPALLEAHHGRWRTWMSITPAEIFSQRNGIKFCRDNVVVGGLGLGWFLSQVAKRSSVRKITLVEKDRGLLDWFGNDLCKRLGAEVICDDIWEVMRKTPVGKTRFALDIWPEWFDARHDPMLRGARRQGHKIWAWGAERSIEYR